MRRRRGDDRGAVITEFAIVGMVIVLVLFGLIEFGFAWETRLTTQNATRAGARVGSSLGNDRLSDYSILQSVQSALGSDAANVDYVVIYKSDTDGGAPPSDCVGDSPASVDGACNVYTGAQLASLTQASFTGTTSCPTATAPDAAWCPLDREVRQTAGTDYLGVYVRLRHQYLLRLFGSELTLTDHSVMRLEPGG